MFLDQKSFGKIRKYHSLLTKTSFRLVKWNKPGEKMYGRGTPKMRMGGVVCPG